jgi:hypothetical protein
MPDLVRRRRRRRILKYVGTLVCVLIAAAFYESQWYMLIWQNEHVGVELAYGRLGFRWIAFEYPGYQPRVPDRLGFTIWEVGSDYRWWLQLPERPDPTCEWFPWQGLRIPLWMFLVVAAVPTMTLWYTDWRAGRRGLCRYCGYDLTGNVSGVCPECGIPSKPDRSRHKG